MYVDNYNKLKEIGDLEFSCKYFLSESSKPATKEITNKYADKSVDEVSREIHEELQNPDGFSLKPDIENGTCERCGKQNVQLYLCSSCNSYVCQDCIAEIVDDIELDPNTMEMTSTEKALCKNCEAIS